MWLRKHRMAVTKILYVNPYVSSSFNLFPHNSVPFVIITNLDELNPSWSYNEINQEVTLTEYILSLTHCR